MEVLFLTAWLELKIKDAIADIPCMHGWISRGQLKNHIKDHSLISHCKLLITENWPIVQTTCERHNTVWSLYSVDPMPSESCLMLSFSIHPTSKNNPNPWLHRKVARQCRCNAAAQSPKGECLLLSFFKTHVPFNVINGHYEIGYRWPFKTSIHMVSLILLVCSMLGRCRVHPCHTTA